MIIKKIETIPMRWNYPSPIFDARSTIKAKSTLLIKIWTDEGVVGIGEAATFGDVPEIMAYLIEKKIKDLIIGKTIEPKRLTDFLFKNTAHYGQRGLVISAISGIEIALLDILGKKTNLPIANFLGGGSKEIKVYASTGYYKHENNERLDLEELEKDISLISKKDFSGIKIKIGKYGLHDDIKRVLKTRELIGADFTLIVDANNSLTVRQTIDFSNEIKKYDIKFIEEPIEFGNPEESRRLRDLSKVAIGGYELDFGFIGFESYIKKMAVDYIQPDVIWSGGIFECLKIAESAKRNLITLIPHNFSTSIALLANLHMLSISDAGNWIEYDKTGNPFIDKLCINSINPKNGIVKINQLPGLGIELDNNFIKQYTIKI